MVINMIADSNAYEQMWKIETDRRFPNAILVMCHGYDANGVWTLHPQDGSEDRPVVNLARELHEEFPLRPIVFVVCNPGHRRLFVPRVYHALDSVFLVPDKFGNVFTSLIPEHVGNVFEFTDDLHDDR